MQGAGLDEIANLAMRAARMVAPQSGSWRLWVRMLANKGGDERKTVKGNNGLGHRGCLGNQEEKRF